MTGYDAKTWREVAREEAARARHWRAFAEDVLAHALEHAGTLPPELDERHQALRAADDPVI